MAIFEELSAYRERRREVGDPERDEREFVLECAGVTAASNGDVGLVIEVLPHPGDGGVMTLTPEAAYLLGIALVESAKACGVGV
ncbi:hypothetical protein ACOTEN_09180 [Achromobacter xylosoxidans]|jgi:hypothetical protein